jgi:ABC-type dipeptide/oligopeptide/nickel transport system permease component
MRREEPRLARFIFFRIIQAIATLVVLSAAVYFGTELTGDAALAMAPGDAKPSEIEAIRRNLGLDRPVMVRYFDYLGGLFIGDFGRSYNKRQPAFDLVLERLPNTVQLALAALIIAVAIGIPLGILSAVKRDSLVDRFGKSFAILGMSMPQFWLAILLMWAFAVEMGILPVFGKNGLDPRYFIIPAFSIAVFTMAGFMRLTRSAMLEVLHDDYIRTARAKGLSERVVIFRHALKNALLPVVTVFGYEFGRLISGTVIIEVIFLVPGMGRLLVTSIFNRDFPMIQAVVLLIAVIVLILNVLMDLLYALLNPRIRYA